MINLTLEGNLAGSGRLGLTLEPYIKGGNSYKETTFKKPSLSFVSAVSIC